MSFSADGGRLAYVQLTRTTNLHKVRFDPAAQTALGAPVSITQGIREVLNFDVSPDGEWVAFGQAGKQEDIWVIRTDGTNLHQLTDDIYRDRGPRWSPDGQWIVFFSNRSGRSEVWTMRLDGSELRQLTDAGFTFPFWSPDGMRIIATRLQRTPAVLDAGRSMQDQTPQPLPGPEDPKAQFQPWSWSPDGRTLAGNLLTGEGGAEGIAVYGFDSRRLERVCESGKNPRWLPGGQRLLFHDHAKLRLLDLRSGKHVEVLSASPHRVGDFFALSRDSRLLCFGLTVTEADIWLMSRDRE
jgi:Tol biopolymer transport system component